MSTTRTRSARPPARPAEGVLRWGTGGLAVVWFALTALGVLALPNVAVVVVLGLLVMLTVEPDARFPHRGVAATRRGLGLALLATAAFVPVALGTEALRGRVPIETARVVLPVLTAVCVALPRLAETWEFAAPAALGHRELILGVTALVAGARGYQAGETVIAMVAFAVLLPVLYGHLQQGSLRVRAGERVRAGQVIGQVGDSGNSGEPHLHLQVQNRPTFDIEDPSLRTYPILFRDATVTDVRRGDSVGPRAGGAVTPIEPSPGSSPQGVLRGSAGAAPRREPGAAVRGPVGSRR